MCDKNYQTTAKALAHINLYCPVVKMHQRALQEEPILNKNKQSEDFLTRVDYLLNHPKEKPVDFSKRALTGLKYILEDQRFFNLNKLKARRLLDQLTNQPVQSLNQKK